MQKLGKKANKNESENETLKFGQHVNTIVSEIHKSSILEASKTQVTRFVKDINTANGPYEWALVVLHTKKGGTYNVSIGRNISFDGKKVEDTVVLSKGTEESLIQNFSASNQADSKSSIDTKAIIDLIEARERN